MKCICANLRDLWETTKRPMRLKKHVGEFAHRSRGATQMPFGMIGGLPQIPRSNTDAMRDDWSNHRSRRRRGRSTRILSHAESCMHRRMPHDGACLICVQTSTLRRGQKSIAQRQAKRRPGLRRSLGLQPAWVDRTMRYRRLFCPLRLTQIGH